MMTAKPCIALAGLALALSACQKNPEAPSVTPATPEPTVTVTTAAPTPTPTTPVPRSSKPVVVAQEPTLCGAEKLSNYLNLLPTSTAKDEIARSVGHNRIRYVGPNDVITQEFRGDRLTAELGVDGRIKEFRCG
jgi:hypothetical protein